MRMLINVFTFNRFICLHMRLIILSLACIGFLISDRCHVRFATLVDNKRDVRDDIEYTWTNLKIVRLGIARTNGWVELAQTVPRSSSQWSSTVYSVKNLSFIHLEMSQCMGFPTMWYVRPAKPQISLRIPSVWSEPLLVAWVFYDC